MFLPLFSFSNRALFGLNWVVWLSFGYFWQSILDILWSPASCVSVLGAQLLKSPEFASHGCVSSSFYVLEPCSVRAQLGCLALVSILLTVYTQYPLVSGLLCKCIRRATIEKSRFRSHCCVSSSFFVLKPCSVRAKLGCLALVRLLLTVYTQSPLVSGLLCKFIKRATIEKSRIRFSRLCSRIVQCMC